MSSRRLPLVGTAPPPRTPPLNARVALPHGAVAVADTGLGQDALTWSVALVEALHRRGATARVTVLGFEREPEVDASSRERLSACASHVASCALAPDPDQARAWLNTQGSTLSPWILIGEPALALFDAPVSVLVGSERPLSSWPPSLRAFRRCFSVELSSARSSIAPRLAELLAPAG